MSVGTYASDQVSVTTGPHSVSGFGPDTFVVVEREVETFTKTTGADGEVSRSKSANKSGSITITLQQTSASNDVLSAFALADEQTNSGTFPVMIKDASGRSIMSAENCWVSAYPSVAFAAASGTYEWVLHADNINMLVGGNTVS